VLGQIGVVFLMFTLGLEFSLRKLKKVGHVIFPTALLDMAVNDPKIFSLKERP